MVHVIGYKRRGASMALRPLPRNQFFTVKTILPIRAQFVRIFPDSSQSYLSTFRFSVAVKMLVSIPVRENESNELMGNQPHLPHGGSKGRVG